MSSGSGSRPTDSLRVHLPRSRHRASPYPSNPPTPGRDTPDSVIARLPTPTTTSSFLEEKLAELRSVIQGVKNDLGGLPPVQSVAGRLEDCLAHLQISEEQNCYECGKLVSGLSDLIPLLWKPFIQSNPRNVPQVIIETVGSIEAHIQDIQASPGHSQTFSPGQGADREKLILERLQEIGEQFRRLRAEIGDWEEKRERWTHIHLEGLLLARDAGYNAVLPASIMERVPCTEHTRVDMLNGVWDWSLISDGAMIYWLNGMAGTGKTTIAYTMCKMLQEDKRLGGSFFCSRNSPDCRDVKKIIPTIAYQLAQHSNIYMHGLYNVFEDDPDIAMRDIGTQFENLISKPLATSGARIPKNVVVVIDALDECTNIDGTTDVLDLLLRYAGGLPIKFFVASRPEPAISSRMMGCDGAMRSIIWLHDIDKSVVQADIRTYLTKALLSVQVTPDELDRLVERAGCLFIFAATAVRYIAPVGGTADHRERLRTLLDLRSGRGSETYKDIDNLYVSIVSSALDDSSLEEEEAMHRRRVLWTVVCVREPLTVSALAEFLNAPAKVVEMAIQPLQSVLHVSEITNVVSTLHASFPDFLLDKERAGQFHCDETAQSAYLTERCFQLMDLSLRFNICGLESSYILDRDVPNLKLRVHRAISTPLFYACRYWGDHLLKCSTSRTIVSALGSFMQHHLLFWMEVLNLKGHISQGDGVLGQALKWLSRESDITDLQGFIHDAYNFVVNFASHPTSLSTPHLYISALPFTSKQSRVWAVYWPRTQGLVPADSKATEWSENPVLATWDVGQEVYSLAESGDGNRIVSGSGSWGEAGEVRVWDLIRGTCILGPLIGHEKWVCAVAFSPDGIHIASGSVDQTIRLWDADSGYKIAKALHGHTASINSLSFSPDSCFLTSGSHDSTIRLWNVRSGDPFGEPLRGHQGCVMSVAFSPNNRQIASGSSDCSVRVWDLQTQANPGVQVLEGHTAPVWSVAYSLDALRLVSGSKDCTVRVWNVGSGTLLAGPFVGHSDAVTSVSFSPCDNRVVSVSRKGTMCIWETGSGKLMERKVGAHSKKINSVIFTGNGTRILSGSEDGTIRVWDSRLRTTRVTKSSEYSIKTMGIVLSPNGTRLASVSSDSKIRVWDTRNGALIVGPFDVQAGHVNSIAFSPDGGRIVSSSKGFLRVWNLSTGELLATLPRGSADDGIYKPVTFSPDGNHIASISERGSIQLWNSHTGRPTRTMFRASGRIMAIAYSPDCNRLASASSNHEVQMWDTKHGKSILWTSTSHTDFVSCVAFSPDGTRVVSGSWDKTILVLDVSDGTVLHGPFTGHTGAVSAVAFSPDGTRIVSGSADQTVRVWDSQSGVAVTVPLGVSTKPSSFVMFSPDGTRVTSGSADGTLRTWDIEAMTQPASASYQGVSIGDDGWLRNSKSQLLLWVPLGLRVDFQFPSCSSLVIIRGDSYSSTENILLLLGDEWLNCYLPSSSPPSNA